MTNDGSRFAPPGYNLVIAGLLQESIVFPEDNQFKNPLENR
jgi:hypothetical protein